MTIEVTLDSEQLAALMRWTNGGDDIQLKDGTDIVYDPYEVETTLKLFVESNLQEV